MSDRSTPRTAPGRRDATASLAPQVLDGLTRRRNAPALVHLCVHLALLGLSGWGVWQAHAELSLMIPALVIHGLLLVFLFAPLHETIHHTAFRSRWINRAVAAACGFLLLLPAGYFRHFHLAHHRHTQDPGRDPELAAPPPDGVASYWLRISGLPYWREQATTLLRHARGHVPEPFIPQSARADVTTEARIHLALYTVLVAASVSVGSAALLLLWIVPALAGQPFLRLFLMAEHAGCPRVTDMRANTRTTLTSAPVRWLAWNMPYHAEHHLYAAIPFHALPQAHRLLRGELRVVARSYVQVHCDLLGALRAG